MYRSGGFTFDFGVLFDTAGGTCDSTGSIVASTALLAINLLVHTCFISCSTCSSTPSSRKASRTPAMTSSITALYNLSCNENHRTRSQSCQTLCKRKYRAVHALALLGEIHTRRGCLTKPPHCNAKINRTKKSTTAITIQIINGVAFQNNNKTVIPLTFFYVVLHFRFDAT